MKVFISWSGTRSEYIANELRTWLPNLLQAVQPFVSTQDIKKGDRGLKVIANQLESTDVGIICLTPENLDKPWILFEAGALSKSSAAYVCTFLYKVESTNIRPPLGEFQFTKDEKDDFKKLCSTINDLLPDDRSLDARRFEATFDTWYPQLRAKLDSVPPHKDDEQPVDDRSKEDKLDEVLRTVRILATAQPYGQFFHTAPVVSSISSAPSSLRSQARNHFHNVSELLRWIFKEGALAFHLCRDHEGYEIAVRSKMIETVTNSEGVPFMKLTDKGLDYLTDPSTP